MEYHLAILKSNIELMHQKNISYIFFFLILFCCGQFSNAQNQKKIDSLQVILKTSIDDTNKVNLLNLIAEEYQSDEPDKAIEFATIQIKLAEKLSFQKGLAKAYQTIAYAHSNKGEYDIAIGFSLKAIKISEQLKDKKALSANYTIHGAIYYFMGNQNKALEYWQQSLNIDTELEDSIGMAKAYNNMAVAYQKLGKNDDALKKLLQASKIDKAKGNMADLSSCLNNIGNFFDDQKSYLQAIDYYNQSLKIKTDNGDKKGISNSLLNVAHIYFEMHNYSKSLEYITQGLSIAKEIGNKDRMIEAYAQLADNYSATKNFQKAYEFQQLAGLTRESMLNEEITQQTAEMDAKYQNEKKEAEILLLNKDKETQATLSLAERKRQQLILISVCVFLFLVIVFVFYILNVNRQKHKANKLLGEKNLVIEKQKNLVEQKNKDITDSINYAKRIQEAILPAKALKRKLFEDAFVLLMPRDIVSGDFYWFTEKNGKRLIAAVDCTGHGVPGAFMSMIGNAFLNEIINENGIVKPSEILDQLREKIISSLKQSEEEDHNRDGMDIALLCIDDKNGTVEFAGANNPFWYVRNGVLTEIKADKQPIAKHFSELFPFTNHKIEIQNGDSLYILSDGYADQFGGEKGKKFRYKQLQELLVSIQHVPMLGQEKILVDTLNKWKGNLEQVDDILVIGVKI